MIRPSSWLGERRAYPGLYVLCAVYSESEAERWGKRGDAADAARHLAISRVEWAIAVTALLAWVKWGSR